MERRNAIKSILGAATISITTISGCIFPQKEQYGSLKLTDIGLQEHNETVAAFVEVQNVSEKTITVLGGIAVYNEENVRVSEWKQIDETDVYPDETVRRYIIFDSTEQAWINKENRQNILTSYTTQYIPESYITLPEPTFSEDDIGDILQDDTQTYW